MKKSFFWGLKTVFWAAQAVWSVVRLFDLRITMEDKKGRVMKAVSRKGDRLTKQRVAGAALSLLLCNLCAFLCIKARARERTAIEE